MVQKSDKEIKAHLRKEISRNPEKYFAVSVLKESGFKRQRCSRCGRHFWAIKKRDFCGDSACSGGYGFIGESPAKKNLDYIHTWKEFARLFKKWGYEPIKRYPVAARWRSDTDFVQASIYDFQPYVVSGEVKPPANPLVVPQLCLRFNDIDNVGITSAHFTCFVMVGQHAFVSEGEWDQKKYFSDIKKWLNEGLGLDDSEIIFHEDAWAGGGNFGPCMEFFSRGIELGNQVYILYEKTEDGGRKEIDIKVLDMGMGLERNAWFCQGADTIYDATFPTVMKKLYKKTGIEVNSEIMRKFLPYSSLLNFDETDDVEKEWKTISEKIGIDVGELKKEIMPLAALYSVAEHSRTLLVALSDGVLPSNVGGGYNLRVLLRRALSFVDKYDWDLDIKEVIGWHAKYLEHLFPELSKNLGDVKKVIDVEVRRYRNTRKKAAKLIKKFLGGGIDAKKLMKIYDTYGISPEMLQREAEKIGRKVDIPEDFYAKVSEMHEEKEQEHATKKKKEIGFGDIAETDALYFKDYKKTEFEAEVVAVNGKNVVLNKTAFYPTSGGQLHDVGFLGGVEVVDVFKQGSIIVHVLASEPDFKKGERISGKVDFGHRKQLAQHHTATHIINAAARMVLGNHVHQAGAKKTREKAHLDITHYESLGDKELSKIEVRANKIVDDNRPVHSSFMDRALAEKKYGLSIYQGGAVPGDKIRIIDVDGLDVEACGGTHVKKTGEVGEIKILKSSKVQDGIVRITFTAGGSAKSKKEEEERLMGEAAELLGVKKCQVPGRARELFKKWKIARKAVRKKRDIDVSKLELVCEDKSDGDLVSETAEILRTQPRHILKTLKKFKSQLENFRSEINK